MDASTGNMSECLRKARILAKMGSALLKMSNAPTEVLEEVLVMTESCALELDKSLAMFAGEIKEGQEHRSMVELVAEIQKAIAELRQARGFQKEGGHLM
jgi:hypothetical protein